MPFTYEYPRMQTTVDTVILDRGAPPSIILIKRGSEPHKGRWALPGGHVDLDETFEAAARREAMEEVGIALGSLTSVGHFDAIDRDPSNRTMTIGFVAQIDRTAPRAGDDAVAAAWFPVTEVPDEIAFDHAEIIAAALAKIGG